MTGRDEPDAQASATERVANMNRAPAPLRAALRAQLAAAGLAPRRRAGQHFMVDAGALAQLAAAVEPTADSRILEVGPGTGLLTRRLLASGADVLAVELDHGLAELLRRELPELRLVEGDALASKSALNPAIEAFAADGPWRLCSNLPYDISIPLLLNCLALPRPPALIAVPVQLEAAERLCAAAGTSAWGASAAVAQAAGSGRIMRRLGRRSFEPPPRVDSAMLLWRSERVLPAGFSAWCRSLFAYRRKRLTRALRDHGMDRFAAERARQQADLDESRRLETLTVEELLRLQAAAAREPLRDAATKDADEQGRR